jgi:excisionase family DNA binding protein
LISAHWYKTYELINSGELRAVKVGRRTYVPVEAAQEWLAAQPVYRDAA